MPDLYIFIAYILIALSPFAIIGGVAYLIYRLRSRSRSNGASAGGGIGTARRLYFYIVSFIALMMSVIGVATIAESALELDWSPDSIASGLALIAVGMPLWWLHWRFVRRSVAGSPIEARATLRKLYLYAVLAISLAVIGYNAFVLIEWAAWRRRGFRRRRLHRDMGLRLGRALANRIGGARGDGDAYDARHPTILPVRRHP